MVVSVVLALALASQATVATDPALVAAPEDTEVAFRELQGGETSAAIARLERLRDTGEADAALLINLGVAYERAERDKDAQEAYRQAMSADEYELEMADGSWHNSRDIARAALMRLEGSSVALR